MDLPRFWLDQQASAYVPRGADWRRSHMAAGCSGGGSAPRVPQAQAAAASGAPSARGLLAGPVYTAVERRPERIAVADLDADGRDDLVLGRNGAKAASSNIVVLATPQGLVGTVLPGGGDVMAFADLDEDGALDLVAGAGGGGSVSLYRGLGDGTFADPVRHPLLGSGLVAVDAVDTDADGDLDLVAAKSGANDVAVLHGDGRGAFSYPVRSRELVNGLGTATAIDLRGDKSADLAVVGYRGLTVLPNNGSGVFANGERIADDRTVQSYRPQLRSADIDVDGHADLLFTGYNAVHIRFGDGRGGFGEAREVRFPRSNGLRFAVGDLNGDALPDLAVDNGSGNSVSVALGNGTGSFGEQAHTMLNDTVTDAAIADVDGDCAPDVIAGNYNRKRIAVLFNTSEITCPNRPEAVRARPGSFPDAPDAPNAVLAGGTGFADPVLTRVGGAYSPPVFIDATGDGHGDLVLNGGYDYRITVRPGNPDGSFAPPIHVPVPALTTPYQPPCNDVIVKTSTRGMSAGPRSAASACAARVDRPSGLAVGDLNGDGRQDLITATADGDSVAVLRGDGRGGFEPQRRYPTGPRSSPREVSAADLNGDGALDLVVRGGLGGGTVMLNDGRGAMTVSGQLTARGPLTVGDIDADGDVDVIAVEKKRRVKAFRVRVLRNDGRAQFRDSIAVGEVRSRSYGLEGLTLKDVDGDGALDVVLVVPEQRRVVVLSGNGRGDFAAPRTWDTGGAEPAAVAVADVNGDDTVDLVVANRISDEVVVLIGDGTGDFASPVRVPTGGNGPFALFLHDVNGDGAADIVVFHSERRDAAVLLAERPAS